MQEVMQEYFPAGDLTNIQNLHQVFQNIRTGYTLAHIIDQCPINAFMISDNR